MMKRCSPYSTLRETKGESRIKIKHKERKREGEGENDRKMEEVSGWLRQAGTARGCPPMFSPWPYSTFTVTAKHRAHTLTESQIHTQTQRRTQIV